MSNNSITLRRRTSYTFSTITVSLVLFMIGASLYFMLNAAKATNTVIDNMKVVVILKKSTSESEVKKMIKAISKNDLIVESKYISSKDAEESFKKFIGEDFTLKLESNPLPSSVEMQFNNKINPKESFAKLKKELKKFKIIDEILYQESMMESVVSNITNLKIVLGLFCIILLFVSFIMIDNTIRMAVLSKRFLIKSMLLIGATRGFIRRPFLLKALMQSFLSTLFASLMLAVLIIGLKRAIPEVEIIYENYKILITIPIIMFITGTVVCLFSTISAVNRYMKLNENDLYTY